MYDFPSLSVDRLLDQISTVLSILPAHIKQRVAAKVLPAAINFEASELHSILHSSLGAN
jgi:hypothetical protein